MRSGLTPICPGALRVSGLHYRLPFLLQHCWYLNAGLWPATWFVCRPARATSEPNGPGLPPFELPSRLAKDLSEINLGDDFAPWILHERYSQVLPLESVADERNLHTARALIDGY